MSIDSKDLFLSLTLFAACGWIAYRVIKRYWPVFGQRKNLTVLQMAERVMADMAEEQQRQATIYGSRLKTFVFSLVLILASLAWMSTLMFSSSLFVWIFGYLVLGIFVNRRIGLPKSDDLTGLGFSDRLFLRIFHGWLWPLYLWVLHKRKQQARDN